MALGAGATFAGTVKAAAHAAAPSFGMGIDAQSTASAVALDAGVAGGVAGLAGGQVLARLNGMAASPAISGNHDGVIFIPVTGDTLALIKLFVNLGRIAVKDDPQVAEAATVRLQGQLVAVEVIMTVGAEAAFGVTAGAQSLVGTGRQGVGDVEVTGMHVVQAAAEGAEFAILAAGAVAVVTGGSSLTFPLTTFVGEFLVAGHAVHYAGFGHGAMVQGPGGAVGLFTGVSDNVHKAVAVATDTGGRVRGYLLQAFTMAGGAVHAPHIGEVTIMVEGHGAELCNGNGEPPQGNTCSKHECDVGNAVHGFSSFA